MTVRSGNSCGCGCSNNRCGGYGTLGYLARSRAASDAVLTGCNGQNIFYSGPCGCVSSGCSGVCYPWQDCSCGCDNCSQTPWNNGCGWNNWNNWGNWNNWSNWGGNGGWNGWNNSGCSACSASFTGRCGFGGESANAITLGFSRGSASDFDVWNNSVRFRWSGRYVASFNLSGCSGAMALALNGNVLGASRSSGGFGQAVFEVNSGDCLSVVPADGCSFTGTEGVTLIIYRIG